METTFKAVLSAIITCLLCLSGVRAQESNSASARQQVSVSDRRAFCFSKGNGANKSAFVSLPFSVSDKTVVSLVGDAYDRAIARKYFHGDGQALNTTCPRTSADRVDRDRKRYIAGAEVADFHVTAEDIDRRLLRRLTNQAAGLQLGQAGPSARERTAKAESESACPSARPNVRVDFCLRLQPALAARVSPTENVSSPSYATIYVDDGHFGGQFNELFYLTGNKLNVKCYVLAPWDSDRTTVNGRNIKNSPNNLFEVAGSDQIDIEVVTRRSSRTERDSLSVQCTRDQVSGVAYALLLANN